MASSAISTAFDNTAIGFFTMADMQGLFVLAVGALATTYVGWTCVRAYIEFGEGQMEAIDVIFYALRAVMIFLFLIYFLP